MNDSDLLSNSNEVLLLKLVSQAGHNVDNQLDNALAVHGLSIAKLGVLGVLATNAAPLALGQIAERLSCVKSNVTQLVDNMELAGLVRRIPDPDDRRSIRAALTEEGRQKYAVGLDVQRKIEQKLFSKLSIEAQKELQSLLRQLSSNPRSEM